MCCVLTVFVNCLVKQFAICLDVFSMLLLKVMELLQYSSLTLLERSVVRGSQPLSENDYTSIIYINISDLARDVGP